MGRGGGGPPLPLGAAFLHVAAAKDGTTLMWAAVEGGRPVVTRWRPGDGPWRVTLPLEDPVTGLPGPAPEAQIPGESPLSPLSPAAAAASASGISSSSGTSGSVKEGSGGGGGGRRRPPPSITLLLSADPWVYAPATNPNTGMYDTPPRQRTLVLQVGEVGVLGWRMLCGRGW